MGYKKQSIDGRLIYLDFKGKQCALCNSFNNVTYAVKQDVALCAICRNLIPSHIPQEQMVRFAIRLIEGKSDDKSSKY